MTDMKRRFFSAPTLQKAVLAAASEYSLDPDGVAYSVVDKRHGFLKVRRNVVIEVDPSSPGQVAPSPDGGPPAVAEGPTTEAAEVAASTAPPEAQPPEDPPEDQDPPKVDREAAEEGEDQPEAVAAPTKPSKQAEAARAERPARRKRAPKKSSSFDARVPFAELPPAEGELAEAGRAAMESLLDLLDLDVDSEIRQGEDCFEVNVTGPDEKMLLADSGRVLRALEHLMPRVMRGFGGESYPCRVDSGDFQESHRQKLEELAQDIAEEVAESGEADFLEPMNPADRRVIHVTLADHEEVATKSVGGGLFKRVKVYPR